MATNSTIEALIFAASEPVSFKDVQLVLPELDEQQWKNSISELNKEYEDQNRAFHIVKIAEGWQFITKAEFSEQLKLLYKHKKKGRLSKPALETLAIVAYKSPVTKAEIEAIRGVNVDGMIKVLLEKEFIKIAGRKDVPGKPIIYTTNKKFMQYFGLKSLDDLPKLEELITDDVKEDPLLDNIKDNPRIDIGDENEFRETQKADQSSGSTDSEVVEQPLEVGC